MKSIIYLSLIVLVFCASLSSQSKCAKKCCCCSSKFKLVKLYELYNKKTDTWFYTTKIKEVNTFVKEKGFVLTHIIGEVAENSTDCNKGKSLIPISRLYNSKILDYLFQSKKDENHGNKGHYESQGIKFYGSPVLNKCKATVTLYRFWNGKSHIYDTNLEDGRRRCGPKCTHEGIICYIWPPRPPKTEPTTTPEPTTTLPPTTTTPRPNITPPSECTMNFARLFRLKNLDTLSHLYTISYDEAMKAYKEKKYDPEAPPGRVTKDPSDCWCTKDLKPVYRSDRAAPQEDHFYTVNADEAANAVSKLGYTDNGIAYYCSSKPSFCGATLPLHRYVKSNKSHFYTIDLNEGKQNVTDLGGKYEGILCYIWPDA